MALRPFPFVADKGSPAPASDSTDEGLEQRHFRTLFVSDLHMGTRACKADLLIDFLRHHTADTLYLVGDIVDGWRLKHAWYWPPSHNALAQKLLRMARNGCRIIYIPGNHDEMLRDCLGLELGGFTLQARAHHVTANGKHLLVLHGDEYDGIIHSSKWLAKFGAWLYQFASLANTVVDRSRRKLGLPYWSLAGFIKHQVKHAVSFIATSECPLVADARKQGFDGVVCGHSHHPEIRRQDGFMYYNTGDWVDNCTALVEHADGSLEILRWVEALGPVRRPKEAA
jgi:UDP-2,3-diacylglucosamine pyrophosphatase LpxH